jgi:hypothetical protein
MLDTISIVLQVIIALGLLNVWILRFNKETPYRGGLAKTLKDEFLVYGLPLWSCYLVGVLKLTGAVLLLVGIKFPVVVLASASVIFFLMFVAFVMHLIIRDPIVKALPAFSLLVISGAVVYINFQI